MCIRDSFEPILQNASNNGGTWREYNVPKEKVLDKTKPVALGSKAIWDYSLKEIETLFKTL